MTQKIDVLVSVISLFDCNKKTFVPKKILFENKEHLIEEFGFHHTFKEGSTLYHIFSVASKTTFFKLSFNTQNLNWRLLEIAVDEL